MKKRKTKLIISISCFAFLIAYCSLSKYLPPIPIDGFPVILVILLIISLVGLYCTKDI